MNYLIMKSPQGDSRKGICGVVIPDGFFVVVEYTEETQPQLQNIRNLPGSLYSVMKTTMPVGHYAPNGLRVTLSSLWDWILYGNDLDYIDKQPEAGAEVISEKSTVRPPVMADRPEYIGLNDIPDDEVDLPPAVLKAREHFASLQAQGAGNMAAPKHELPAVDAHNQIDLESDVDTLGAAGATDEVAMLRAALDTRQIPYSQQAKAPALRKKLETANAA
jgi:hypothetical protein